MKNFLIVTILLFLTACFGEAKFDASSETSIKESTQKIVDGLPKDRREEFQKAVMYFSLGGEKGLMSMLGAAFSGRSPGVTPEAMLSMNLEKITGLTGEQILKKYSQSLEQERIKQEEREKVSALGNEASKLLKSYKFEEALLKYKAMGEISSGIEAAEAGVENTSKAMAKFTEKMEYIDKVKITEFLAKRIDTYSIKGAPAVRISLKNSGDRSLDKVKVIVYFQDKDGNTIFEEDYHPVLVSEYSFGGDNKPLKPGYVKEMEKDKYYTLESALSDWKEGKAIAKIVDIEFTETQ